MTAQLVLRFDNADDLMRVLIFLRDNGLAKLSAQKKAIRKKLPDPPKRDWSLAGSVSLGGKLDHVNIRDYAYED